MALAVVLFVGGFSLAVLGQHFLSQEKPPGGFDILASAPLLSTALGEDLWSSLSPHIDARAVGVVLYSSQDEEQYLIWEPERDNLCALKRLSVAFDETEIRWTHVLVCDDTDTAQRRGLLVATGRDDANSVSLVAPDGYEKALIGRRCIFPVERNLVRFGTVDVSESWSLPLGTLPSTDVVLVGPAGDLSLHLPVTGIGHQGCL